MALSQKERSRKHYQAHKAELAAKRKERYHANLDESRAYHRDHYEKNRATRRAQRRASYYKNISREKAYSAQYRADGYTRNNRYMSQYNISAAEVDNMIAAQDGKCKICQVKTDVLHLDHDHETGQVRDMLCGSCNRALGLIKEKESVLLAMIYYLNKWKWNPLELDIDE